MRHFFYVPLVPVLFLLLIFNTVALAFSGGDGSPGDPYQIKYLAELQDIAEYPDKNFLLMNNIDATETLDWNGGLGFIPILNFSGSLDGQGYEIGGLFINRATTSYVGLFSELQPGATVSNVKLVSGSVTGNGFVGFLAGSNNGGRISGCQSSGRVNGGSRTGGLVGALDDSGIVTGSSASGNVSGTSICVGGLVGQVFDGTIANSHATGTVDGTDTYVGGLVGVNNGIIADCFAANNVNGTEEVGGLAGKNSTDGKITRCSTFLGTVQGASAIGGLVGKNFVGGEISLSFAFDEARGDSYIGGLVGSNYFGSVTRSYARGKVLAVYPSFPSPENDFIGGLVGINYGTITECYATGFVDTYDLSNPDYIGGLVGHQISNTATMTSMSYWDKETTGCVTSS